MYTTLLKHHVAPGHVPCNLILLTAQIDCPTLCRLKGVHDYHLANKNHNERQNHSVTLGCGIAKNNDCTV